MWVVVSWIFRFLEAWLKSVANSSGTGTAPGKSVAAMVRQAKGWARVKFNHPLCSATDICRLFSSVHNILGWCIYLCLVSIPESIPLTYALASALVFERRWKESDLRWFYLAWEITPPPQKRNKFYKQPQPHTVCVPFVSESNTDFFRCRSQ